MESIKIGTYEVELTNLLDLRVRNGGEWKVLYGADAWRPATENPFLVSELKKLGADPKDYIDYGSYPLRKQVEPLLIERRRLVRERRARADAERAADRSRRLAAARAECPDDCEPCDRSWANGDLMSAEYVSQGGTRVLDSDLLEPHHGFYFVSRERIEAAREKWLAEKEEGCRRKQAERDHCASVIAEARRTGQPQVLREYTRDCRTPNIECSTDIVSVLIDQDGIETETITHTY